MEKSFTPLETCFQGRYLKPSTPRLCGGGLSFVRPTKKHVLNWEYSPLASVSTFLRSFSRTSACVFPVAICIKTFFGLAPSELSPPCRPYFSEVLPSSWRPLFFLRNVEVLYSPLRLRILRFSPVALVVHSRRSSALSATPCFFFSF